MTENLGYLYEEGRERFLHSDQTTDHSLEALSNTERQEIELFNSIRHDPYFRHYIHNSLSRFADDTDDTLTNLNTGVFDTAFHDHLHFGRIKSFDLKRAMQAKQREATIYAGGKSWGAASRKACHATCSVRAGSGKVIVNHKPMEEYFKVP